MGGVAQSKEQLVLSDGFLEHPKRVLKLMNKNIFTILRLPTHIDSGLYMIDFLTNNVYSYEMLPCAVLYLGLHRLSIYNVMGIQPSKQKIIMRCFELHI